MVKNSIFTRVHNRINYINFQEIFPIKPGLKDRVEIVKLDLGEEYPEPFNYFITLHDVYLFPERVKEYAESLQYTNAASIVNYAPVSRTYASISAVVTETLTEIIGNVYGRHFTHYPQDYIAMFSFMSDDAMTFHRHNDGHFDIQDNDEKILNGVLHLEDHIGTELMMYKDIHHMTRPLSGASATFPKGADSHLKTVARSSGKCNTLNCYYGHILHRPDFPSFKDKHKGGRLIQNLFYDDMTRKYIVDKTAEASKKQFDAIEDFIKYDTMNDFLLSEATPWKDNKTLKLTHSTQNINKMSDPIISKYIKAKKEVGIYDISFKKNHNELAEEE